MSSSALESQGMTLGRGDAASPEVFTTIPEATNFSGPGGSAAVIDVTDLSSTAKEKRMGLNDEGQLSFTINYIPANTVHAGLRADRTARTLRVFRLTFTDSPNTLWTFSAYVTGFAVDNAVPTSNVPPPALIKVVVQNANIETWGSDISGYQLKYGEVFNFERDSDIGIFDVVTFFIQIISRKWCICLY